ncbi:tripartite motif-containing protein 59-like [Actinia tenebrosa]|uniref:Tripartite motif-containing protein 59-like n=1 Tax=Actinia tenebrosa TaxID=6105 RepID=A0A6P8H4Z4_ACTTE|nr:tripartite motif-containing protein 59-like [Actinia tenebrosa]
MAESKLLSISLQEDELCCPVCFDELEEPKALPQCLHNFCKKCLESIKRAGNRNQLIECPTCRVNSVLPEGSVDRLPTNHFLKSLVERIPGRKEKLELKKIVQECESNFVFCKAKLQEKTTSLKIYEQELQRLLQVRRDICDHAKYLIDIIQESSKMLCFQIDNHIAETSSLIAKHEQCNGNLIDIASKASDFLENAKALLKRNDQQEISGSKKAIEDEVQRLNDSILFRISDANSLDGNFKEIEFKKMNEETSGEKIFGVLREPPTLNLFTFGNLQQAPTHSHSTYWWPSYASLRSTNS